MKADEDNEYPFGILDSMLILKCLNAVTNLTDQRRFEKTRFPCHIIENNVDQDQNRLTIYFCARCLPKRMTVIG